MAAISKVRYVHHNKFQLNRSNLLEDINHLLENQIWRPAGKQRVSGPMLYRKICFPGTKEQAYQGLHFCRDKLS